MSFSDDVGQRQLPELAPADALDPVVEAYKKDIDRTLLRENLKLTVEQRLQKAEKSSSLDRLVPRGSPRGQKAAVIASLEAVLRVLQEHDVRFIVVGGWASIIHGSARSTNDVDLVYARDSENLERLAAALSSQQPYLRGAPPGLPFRWDLPTIDKGP
jgi:hypothetical protein